MGILKKVFGDKGLNIQKTFDTVSKGINNLKLTEQERVEGLAGFVKDTLAENSIRSVARRTISYLVVGVFLFLVLVAAITYKIDPEYSKFIYTLLDDTLSNPFLMVLAFFFGSHLLRSRKK